MTRRTQSVAILIALSSACAWADPGTQPASTPPSQPQPGTTNAPANPPAKSDPGSKTPPTNMPAKGPWPMPPQSSWPMPSKSGWPMPGGIPLKPGQTIDSRGIIRDRSDELIGAPAGYDCHCNDPTISPIIAPPVMKPRELIALSVEVKPMCPPKCPAQVEGRWTLTFIPGADRDAFINPGADGPAVDRRGGKVTEVRADGLTASFTAPRAGKLLARFSGRVTCNGIPCQPLLTASAEFDIAIPPPTPEQLAGVVNGARAKLPSILGASEAKSAIESRLAELRKSGTYPGKDDRYLALVEQYHAKLRAWFTQQTGWAQGDQYSQTFDLPPDAVAVNTIDCVSSVGASIYSFACEPAMEAGGSAFGHLAAVWGDFASARAGVEKDGDHLQLTLKMPVADRQHVRVMYTGTDGKTHQIELRCQGTTGPRGPVSEPTTAPQAGVVRIVLCNVDPTRFSNETRDALTAILRALEDRFAAKSHIEYQNLQSQQGFMSAYQDIRFSGTPLSAQYVSQYLTDLARILNAELTVRDGLIMIQGRDIPDEPVLPVRYNGTGR